MLLLLQSGAGEYRYVPDTTSFVPTVETTRLAFLARLLLANHHNVMLVGNSGECRRIYINVFRWSVKDAAIV